MSIASSIILNSKSGNGSAKTPGRRKDWLQLADDVLAGAAVDRAKALAILNAPDEDVPDLLAGAYRIRRRHFGNVVKLNFLVNAKSGLCPEDCSYCSQSKISDADIQRYPMLSREQILEQAEQAVRLKASTCCIVISARGPSAKEVVQVCDAVRQIKSEHPGLKVCACMGILSDEQAHALKAAGVDRYNHNLNTAESHYGEVCTTHTYADRVRTVAAAKAAGLSPCSGGIVGLGESREHLVDLAFALRDAGVDSIPVNFLLPIGGTPLADHARELTPRFCLKVLCMVRYVCPDREIRVSAGREKHLRTLQPLSLYPANAIFVADYLTTEGQSPTLDWQMIEDLGFEMERVS